MNDAINILLGLQIGIQLVAAYFVLRIINMKSTPYLPYILALIALLLMAIVRLDWIFAVMSPVVKITIQTSVSVLWMVCFIKIYSLVKNK